MDAEKLENFMCGQYFRGMSYKSQSNLRANLVDILIADFNSDGLYLT
jgi:hypothetical protein